MIKKILRSIAGSQLQTLKDIQKKYFPRKIDKIEKAHLADRAVFYKTFINSNDLVFDVGANMGNRVIPLLSVGADIVAVEPQKECYTYLKKKFGNKIKIVPLGLSDKEETREFFISDATVFSSFSKEWIDSVKKRRLRMYNWNKSVEVKMTTLDNLIKQYGTPTFIKVDVEGFELHVLKGLSKKVKMISYEYTTPEQTLNAQQCIQHLKTIDAGLLCNYCVGEEMNFKLPQWLGADDMIQFIASDEFTSTRFGDIYVKMNS